MIRLKIICLAILVFIFSSDFLAEEIAGELDEDFTEALLLRPLPDRKALAHFHFQSNLPPTRIYGRHHHLFPKTIYQLCDEPKWRTQDGVGLKLVYFDEVHKFQIREMELSFTQGRWNYERWGGYDPISSSKAKPPGVELWAEFDVPQDQVDESWKNLTHALSGLFCASINFLEHSTTYFAPRWSFRSLSGKLRYGTLPREAVCTENLTPWLKLLPCRDKAGLSALMNRPSIYRGYYHSQRLHLTSDEFDVSESNSGIMLEQTLTVVLQPSTSGAGVTFSAKLSQPSWSLSSLFGRKVHGKCSLSNSSNVYIQFEQNLVSELKKLSKQSEGSDKEINEGFLKNSVFEMSPSPKRVIKEIDNLVREGSILYEFPIDEYDKSEPLDLALTWKIPVIWSCQQAPLHASRFLLGSGNERGGIAILLKSTGSNYVEKTYYNEKECWMRVEIFQLVPWYVKVYYHTLQVFVDGELQSTTENIESIRVSPSEDKVSPGVMEMVLRLPCGVKTAALTLDFDKGFLHIDEYPPDANQGFDIPSAIVNLADFQANVSFGDGYSKTIPILAKLQEKFPILSYTEVLLVPLTTPDFSMPYNVITITCTIFALYFGSMLNALRKRVGEEERLQKINAAKKAGPVTLILSKIYAKLRGRQWEPPKPSSPSTKSNSRYKLIVKVVIVAGLAVAWQYYSE